MTSKTLLSKSETLARPTREPRAMKVAVIGTGYVGLVTGACLAKRGHELVLVDIDAEKVAIINHKASPICEPYLTEILEQVELSATSYLKGVKDAEVLFICVGTPLNENGCVSLAQVTKAARQIGRVLEKKKGYCVITLKSTVPPGTTEKVVIPLLEKSGKKTGVDFGVCMSPEFLRAGQAVNDFMKPDRIVIGEYDRRSGDRLTRLFHGFEAPILRTNLKTAEMIKLAANAFLASKISLVNELGNICKQLGIDTYQVAQGMGYDLRIGDKFLSAGIGFGGSCLPKDLNMLTASAKLAGYEPNLLKEVSRLNDGQTLRLLDLLRKHISLKGATVGLLGLAFKPETDDIRGSKAIPIAAALLGEAAAVKAYDPVATDNFRKLFPQIDYVPPGEVLNCDAILILTEWEEFNHLDYRRRVVIDGRRIPKAREARIYEGICW